MRKCVGTATSLLHRGASLPSIPPPPAICAVPPIPIPIRLLHGSSQVKNASNSQLTPSSPHIPNPASSSSTTSSFPLRPPHRRPKHLRTPRDRASPASASSNSSSSQRRYLQVPEEAKKDPRYKRHLQRNAPPPRPRLPVPASIASLQQPFAQPAITLSFHPTFASDSGTDPGSQSADVSITVDQITGFEAAGMVAPSSAVASADELIDETNLAGNNNGEGAQLDLPNVSPLTGVSPRCTHAPPAETSSARPPTAADELDVSEGGSGTIVWDCALHLAHHLEGRMDELLPTPTKENPLYVLEMGAGTGVLGLAVEAMVRARQQAQVKSTDADMSELFKVVLTDEGEVLKLLNRNVEKNQSKALVVPFDWSDADTFVSQLSTSSSSSSSSSSPSPSPSSLPPYFSVILCSELLDAIPGSGNRQRAFDADSFRTLVQALTTLAKHSAQTKRRMNKDGGVTVWFTFEQRGVLSLGPDGLIDELLLRALRSAGFEIEQVFTDVFQQGSPLCLFRFDMK